MYRNNMQCCLCKSEEKETQEHLETCEFTEEMRKNLNIKIREDKIVLWRKITMAIKKDMNQIDSNVNSKKDNKSKSTHNELKLDTKDCETIQNPEGQGYFLPAPSKKTCPGSREGIATHAVAAFCARDMSVGEVISDQPRNKMFINRYQNKKK